MNSKTLSAALLDKAASLRLSLTGMHCSATADYKAGALKAAAVFDMVAGWAERMSPAKLAEECQAASERYLRAAKDHKPGTAAKSEYVQGAKALMDAAEMARQMQRSRRALSRPAPAESSPTAEEDWNTTVCVRAFTGPTKSPEVGDGGLEEA